MPQHSPEHPWAKGKSAVKSENVIPFSISIQTLTNINLQRYQKKTEYIIIDIYIDIRRKKSRQRKTSFNTRLIVLIFLGYSHWSLPGQFGIMGSTQKFQQFRSEFKWNGLFWFLPTRIFGITSGGGPLILTRIFWPKFAIPFLTNRFFALIREFGKNDKSHSNWLA